MKVLKTLTFSLVLLFGVFLAYLSVADTSAQEDTGITLEEESRIIPLPPQNDLPTFLGQDHFYTVTFRGNGEAVITSKIILTNFEEEALSKIELRVPKIEPKDLAVFQVIRERVCIRYEPTLRPVGPGENPRCLQYQEPDYYQSYGNNKYQKAKFNLSGDTVEVELPNPIKANGSGAFVVYFRGFGYTDRNLFGAFNYTFETLKVDDKIRDLMVGIETDSDLYLKDAKGKVDYRFDDSGIQELKAADGLAASSPSFDRFYQRIGRGSIIKKASNLQPLESYSVKGSYADSKLKLYGKEILIGTVVVLAILVVILLAARFVFRGKLATLPKDDKMKNFLGATGASFVSSLVIAGYSVLLFWGASQLQELFYEFGVILVILLGIISVGVYALFLFAPSIFLGIKKGFGWGVTTFVLTLVWLGLFLGVTFAVLFLSGDRRVSIPRPVPLIDQ